MNVAATHGSTLIRTALETTSQVAGRWARADLSDLPRDIVTLSGARRSVRIGAAILRAVDEMEGTLVDLFA